MLFRFVAALLAAFILSAACGTEPEVVLSADDAGVQDAGTDASSDTGFSDSGGQDTGALDTGVADAGVQDAGHSDAGGQDAGMNLGTPPPFPPGPKSIRIWVNDDRVALNPRYGGSGSLYPGTTRDVPGGTWYSYAPLPTSPDGLVTAITADPRAGVGGLTWQQVRDTLVRACECGADGQYSVPCHNLHAGGYGC